MAKAKVKKLTKGEIIKTLAEKLDLKKGDIKQFLLTQAELAYSEVKRCGEFVFYNIGKLVLKDRKARMGRNPATGETIKIPAKTVLKFRIGKVAKVGVLGEQKKRKVKK